LNIYLRVIATTCFRDQLKEGKSLAAFRFTRRATKTYPTKLMTRDAIDDFCPGFSVITKNTSARQAWYYNVYAFAPISKCFQ
jgi:hypothetical protein